MDMMTETLGDAAAGSALPCTLCAHSLGELLDGSGALAGWPASDTSDACTECCVSLSGSVEAMAITFPHDVGQDEACPKSTM